MFRARTDTSRELVTLDRNKLRKCVNEISKRKAKQINNACTVQVQPLSTLPFSTLINYGLLMTLKSYLLYTLPKPL